MVAKKIRFVTTTLLWLLVMSVFVGADQKVGCGGGTGGGPGSTSGRSTDYPCTKYPIVLAHGFSGWDEIAGYEYFFGVEDYLEGLGCDVYVTQVDAYNTIEVRGNQLADQILDILQTSGANKVNIIGHSMGGLDARYAITHRGLGAEGKVAALVTVSTPHQGTTIADVFYGLITFSNTEWLVDFILSIAGCTLLQGEELSDCEQSAYDATWNLTTEYIQKEFNPNTPDDPNVAYFSYAGITGLHSTDLVDPLLLGSYGLIYLLEGDNDGLCSVNSAKWGEFMGTVDADHLDEIGQLAGITGFFNHYEFYQSIAGLLRNRGF